MKIRIPLPVFALILATNALQVRNTASGPVAAGAAKRVRPSVSHDAEIHRSLPVRPGPPRAVLAVHLGCEFLAFSNRALKTVDLQVSTSMRSPAECIAWLRNNLKVYQAVEYNIKSSSCRAVKLAKWNNTVSSHYSTLYAQKPSVLGNPSALLWYNPFDAKYGGVSEHHIINIHKKIKKYVRKVPTRWRIHIERILISAYRSKLAIKEAAKRYHKKYNAADKSLSSKFEAWWFSVEKYLRAAVKFIDGKVEIKSLRIEKHRTQKQHLNKHKKHAAKKTSLGSDVPAQKLPSVTSILNLANSAKLSLVDAAKKVHGDALKAGTVKQDFNVWWRSMKLHVENTMRAKSVQSKKFPTMKGKQGGVKIAIKTKL